MAENTITTTSEFWTCRRILCLMIITCFMVQYMVRVNMSIAIVEMISKNQSDSDNETTFQWTEHQKNDILGCFFWGFLLTAIPGGRLSEIYGTRLVLGSAMFLSSILTIITPLACNIHYYCVIVVRFLLGFALGVSWPSIPPLAIKWVAPEDTAKFMSHTIACALGGALALPLCGYLIAYLGWPSTFYVTGVIALFWSVFWFYHVYDSPEKHPRISKEEKESIKSETQKCNFKQEVKIPWGKLLTSGPVWAIIIADISMQFNINVLLNELPSYMHEVLQFNIKQNGLLSSLPFIATYVAAVIFTFIADKWRKSEKFSTLTIRKSFTVFPFAVANVLYVIQIFWGYDRYVSVFVFTSTQFFLSATTAGFISNSMDISPLYSGTIFGLAFTGGASTGFISAKIVAVITSTGVTFEHWRWVFLFLVIANCVGGVLYCILADAKIQKWNPRHVDAVEMKNLNVKD